MSDTFISGSLPSPEQHARRKRSTSRPSLQRKVAFLDDARNFPEAMGHVESIETHMSWIFLTPTRAYKLKKPVRYRSLDYRSLTARRRNCESELALNRRLAPDVYLAVLPLNLDDNDQLHLAGPGKVVDWLIEMKRLPETRTLLHALCAHYVTEHAIRHVGERLATFFIHERINRADDAGDIIGRFNEDIASASARLRHGRFSLPPEDVERVARSLTDFLERRSSLITDRLKNGKFVEGHGDLRPEHVYLARDEEPLVITDCLEFDHRLRILDPLDELAFLAMECEYLGETRAWAWLFDSYFEASHDSASAVLCNFYAAYRAFQRARISFDHVTRCEKSSEAHEWRDRAARYLSVSATHC